MRDFVQRRRAAREQASVSFELRRKKPWRALRPGIPRDVAMHEAASRKVPFRVVID